MRRQAPRRALLGDDAAGYSPRGQAALGAYETVEDSSEAVATELAEQVWLEVRDGDRLEALCRVMDVEEDFFGIVFTTTRVEAERVAKALEERGYDAEALHGEIPQDQPRADPREIPREGRCASSSRPTSPHAASTSTISPTSSIGPCRTTPRPTSTGSGARAARATPAPPSPW